VDGGNDTDTLELNAVGATPFTLTAHLKSIEILSTQGGDITLDDDALDNEAITVEGGTTQALTFDGSSEDDSRLTLNGTSFNDSLTGGQKNDAFNAGAGNDTIHGEGGKDAINFTNDTGSSLTAADNVDGGAGVDTLTLSGFYDGANALTLGANTIENIEKLVLLAGNVGGNNFRYDITLDDGNVAAGKTLIIDTTDLRNNAPATINGRAESDGNFVFVSADAGDNFTGGEGDDTFIGGEAADVMTGGDGADLFQYGDVSDSTGTAFDTIATFDAAEDHLGFTFAVTGVDAAVTSGALSRSTFDTDMAAAVGAAQLGGHHAVIFTPTGGFYAGHTFLVVDANGTAGFQADADFVIELSAPANLGSLAGAFVVV
jgi:Ca2+-binding RTX toxin-like protein